jgi:hypothetical protein
MENLPPAADRPEDEGRGARGKGCFKGRAVALAARGKRGRVSNGLKNQQLGVELGRRRAPGRVWICGGSPQSRERHRPGCPALGHSARPTWPDLCALVFGAAFSGFRAGLAAHETREEHLVARLTGEG